MNDYQLIIFDIIWFTSKYTYFYFIQFIVYFYIGVNYFGLLITLKNYYDILI